MRKKVFNFMGALLVLLSVWPTTVQANSTTYYSKTTAISTGDGVVYVTNNADAPSQEQFSDTISSEMGTAESTHTYYLHALAGEGKAFSGWYADEACETLLGTDNPFPYAIEAKSTAKATPTEFTVYAKFEELKGKFYSTLTVKGLNGSKVCVNTISGANREYVTDTVVSRVTENTSHQIFYLSTLPDAAQENEFLGWYADEECTLLLSLEQFFTYEATANSEDEENPTPLTAYAKYELRNPYQLLNAGFEMWNDALSEPNPGWNSFPSASGSFASIAGSGLDAIRAEGMNGGYAAQIKSISKVGVGANGNLTTGRINAGSMSASDATGNYNYTDLDDGKYNTQIAGLPDSITFYSKFSPSANNQNGCGHVQLYLHSRFPNFQDPVVRDGQQDSLIAQAGANIAPSEDWAYSHVALEYNEAFFAAPDRTGLGAFAFINFTTNPTPGQSAGDVLTIDDVRLVYNSEMAYCVYDTTAFHGSKILIRGDFDPAMFQVMSNGRSASADVEYNEEAQTINVTVKGQDIAYNPTNCHSYELTIGHLYQVTYLVDGKVIAMQTVEAGQPIPQAPTVEGTPDIEWRMQAEDGTADVPEVMPEHDIILVPATSDAIRSISMSNEDAFYTLDGKLASGTLRPGLYIRAGKTVLVK